MNKVLKSSSLVILKKSHVIWFLCFNIKKLDSNHAIKKIIYTFNL